MLLVRLQHCFPLCWNCFALSSCSQSPALPFALSVLLSPPSFAVSLLWHSQHAHTRHFPVCFFFLTATHRKFSYEGGFVKRPLSLCVASELFPFYSSCHSSLLLSLSSLMNLICFPFTEGAFRAVTQHTARETAASFYSLLKAIALCKMFSFLRGRLDDLQRSLPSLTILWFSVSSLLSHYFLCNLRWALHFSTQLWTLGFGKNQHLCHLSLSNQSHLL